MPINTPADWCSWCEDLMPIPLSKPFKQREDYKLLHFGVLASAVTKNSAYGQARPLEQNLQRIRVLRDWPTSALHP